MESANLHHQHQLQDHQLLVVSPSSSSSSSLVTPPCYALGTNIHASWNPSIILHTGDSNPNSSGLFLNTRDPRQKNDMFAPQLNSSMIQDLGFHHWATNEQHLAKIKEEHSDYSFLKFPEIINNPSSIEDFHLAPTTIGYLKNENPDLNELYSSAAFGGVTMPSRGSFSQIFPSINISNMKQSTSSSPETTISSTLDMNLQALDILTGGRFNGGYTHPSHNNLGLFKESFSFDHGHDDHMQPSNCPDKLLAFRDGVTEAKRPRSFLEQKASQQPSLKKPRLESRNSCPPFKVRKEKLGDRVASLQQLVAPFGKTDTASVLMEAIGYIKFLQNQVETLSVPYMKSSHKPCSRAMQLASMEEDEEDGETKRDLRSRGLCLVPLSCMTYITDDGGGGGVWPLPNFH